MPSTLRVDNNLARLVASADLTLRGTYDRPVIAGHADIERGEVNFEGRRYRITRGAIDFNNPTRTEPFFDIEAETNVRVAGPPARPTTSTSGSPARPNGCSRRSARIRRCRRPTCWRCSSATCGATTSRTSSCARCRTRTRRQTDILAARATQALTAPISAEVGQGRRADVRRRHVPADAVVRRSVRPADVAASIRRRASRSASASPIAST